MKKLTLILLSILMIVTLVACGDKECEHTYDNACDTICNLCSETRKVEGHIPEEDDGNCLTEITCSVCGTVTTPAMDSHTGGTATCTAKAVCTVCSTAYGTVDANNHIDENTDHSCDRECGMTNLGTHADSDEDTDHVCDYGCKEILEDHQGGTATCVAQAVCTICGNGYGELNADNHASTEFTYTNNGDGTHNTLYACCEEVYTENDAHTFSSTTGNCQFCAVAMAKAKVTSGGEDTYYETLASALGAAQSGDTVTLCSDVDFGTTARTIPAGVTFCGGEYTVIGNEADWLHNYGTIANGTFECSVLSYGIVRGGAYNYEFINAGEVVGGEFTSFKFEENSTLSGSVTIKNRGTLDYRFNCTTIDLSNATLDGAFLFNASYEKLSISSLKLPDGYAVEYNGAVVSVLLAQETGKFVSHTHAYEDKNDDTHHWTECACGKTTEEAEHSYTYTDNGDGTHDYACPECGYVEVDNEKHTAVADSNDCICGATVIAVIDGTLGGKTEATEEDIEALVEQLKAYVDSGITTIIVTGSNPAMIDMGSWTNTAVGEAIYRLSGSDVYDENNPYNGKIDLILPDVTEIVTMEFYNAFALNSITLPKVTTLGDQAFYGAMHLRKITFGSVLTEVNETGGVMFYVVGEKVGGCDLILNSGQMNESSVPAPDLTTNTWTILYKNEFKSIALI